MVLGLRHLFSACCPPQIQRRPQMSALSLWGWPVTTGLCRAMAAAPSVLCESHVWVLRSEHRPPLSSWYFTLGPVDVTAWVWPFLCLNFKTKICNEAVPVTDTQESSSPLIHGAMFRDPQWMPETAGNTELSYILFFIHTYDKVLFMN